MTLVEFLLARIADDEAMLAKVDYGFGEHAGADGSIYLWTQECDGYGSHAASGVALSEARLRAECEAKRRIVALHETIRAAYPGTTIETEPCCSECSAGGEYPGTFPCETVRLLAVPYADHPEYDEAWRP